MLIYRIPHILLLLCLLLPVSASAQGWIAVLLSDTESIYEKPLQTFHTSMRTKVRDFNLQGNIRRNPHLKAELFTDPPDLIFALGAKAAFAAKMWTADHQDIPVIFAMVINHQKYRLLDGQDNMAGISYEVNPGNQFINLTLFAPEVQKIGVIYSNVYSRELVNEARKATHMLGLELIERSVSSNSQYRRAYKELSLQVDALWVLNDPITFTLDNMDWLLQRCVSDKLVCVGQSSNLSQVGMLLSVQADTANIGAQAASMAKNILERQQAPSTIGVMEPLGTTISVNRVTANRIGLALNALALNMATEVIE